MTQPTSNADILHNVEFQISLLHISLLGATAPQAEELESLLDSRACPAGSPKQ